MQTTIPEEEKKNEKNPGHRRGLITLPKQRFRAARLTVFAQNGDLQHRMVICNPKAGRDTQKRNDVHLICLGQHAMHTSRNQ